MTARAAIRPEGRKITVELPASLAESGPSSIRIGDRDPTS
jgi:hypothetical protein